MPAPKGNQFWKARTTHGKPPKFTPEELDKACEEYYEWIEANPLQEAKAFAYQGEVTIASLPKMNAMTLGGLCLFLGIGRTTWKEYAEKEDYTEVITRAEEVIRRQKFAGAAAELLNSNIIARDLGLVDKKELTAKLAKISSEPLSDEEWEKEYGAGK